MKDLFSGWLMKLLEKWHVKPYKRLNVVEYMSFGCFWLALLAAIIGNDLESGSIVRIVPMALMLLLLAASGYLLYQCHFLWLPLALFGAADLVIAFVIPWNNLLSALLFAVVGAALILAGTFFAPRQMKMHRVLSKESKELIEKEKSEKVRAEMIKMAQQQEKAHAEEKPTGEKKQLASLEKLKEKLAMSVLVTNRPDHQQRPEEIKKQAQEHIADLQLQLGKMVLQQEKLWVLTARVSGAKPVYMGTDGRMEVFTDKERAHKACEMLKQRLQVQVDVLELDGSEAIHTFFGDCAYNGFAVMRLDNGTHTLCELWLKNFVQYQAENPLDAKNCSLRHMLYRAKLYAELRTKQPEGSEYIHTLTEMGMTMALNAYRELYQGVVYALGDKQEEARVYATAKAQETMKEWNVGIADETLEKTMPLHLFYVNRPGETGQIDKGMVCAFTDLKHAQSAQEMFIKANMPTSITIMTGDELLSHAAQCAGIVIDMQSINYEISKSEFDKIRITGTLDAPVLVNLKKPEQKDENPQEKPAEPTEKKLEEKIASSIPVLRDKQKNGAWMRYDFQWPGRFGYDYMVKIAQWLIDDGLEPKTLVTGTIGGKEEEYIEKWKELRYVSKSVSAETGFLGIGGFHRYVPAPVKVYFFNQTNVVRFFVAGEVRDKDVQDFAERIAQAKLS